MSDTSTRLAELEAELAAACAARGDADPETLELRLARAVLLCDLDRFADAEREEALVVAVRRERLGEQHPDTIAARSAHAGTLFRSGQVDQAIAEQDWVIAACIETLGEDEPTTVEERSYRAIYLRASGRLPEALADRDAVVTAKSRRLGEEHPGTLLARASRALVLRDLDRGEEALSELLELVSIFAASEEVPSREALRVRWDVANTLGYLGRNDDAVSEFDVLVAAYAAIADEATEAEMHQRRLRALEHAGRFEEAYDEACWLREHWVRRYGPDHQTAIQGLVGCASWLRKLGRHEEALDERSRAVEAFERASGSEHLDTIEARASRAITLSDLDKRKEALDEYTWVADACARNLGPQHPRTVKARICQAWGLSEVERYEEALAHLDWAIGTLSESPSSVASADIDDLSVEAHADRVRVLDALGRPEAALEDETWLVAHHLETLGVDVPRTLDARIARALRLRELMRYQEELGEWSAVVEARTRSRGPDHPDTIQLRALRAVTLKNLGRDDEATSERVWVVNARARTLGVEHEDTIRARNNVAGAMPWFPPEVFVVRFDSAEAMLAYARRQAEHRGHEVVGSAHLLIALVQMTDEGERLQALGLLPPRLDSLLEQLWYMELLPEQAQGKGLSNVVEQALESAGSATDGLAKRVLRSILTAEESDVTAVLRHCGLDRAILLAVLSDPAPDVRLFFGPYLPSEQDLVDDALRQLYVQVARDEHPALGDAHDPPFLLKNVLYGRSHAIKKGRGRGIRGRMAAVNLFQLVERQAADSPSRSALRLVEVGDRHFELAADRDADDADAHVVQALLAMRAGLIEAQEQYLIAAQLHAHLRLSFVLEQLGLAAPGEAHEAAARDIELLFDLSGKPSASGTPAKGIYEA